MQKNVLTMVKCPRCGKTVPWRKTHSYRPFCSERCKLIDLGDWASENHAIPGEEIDPLTIDKAED